MKKNRVYQTPLTESIILLNEGAVLSMSSGLEGYGPDVNVELTSLVSELEIPAVF